MIAPDGEAGQVGHHRRDVAEAGEQAGAADHGDRQREPDLGLAKRAQLVPQLGRVTRGVGSVDRHHRGHAPGGHHLDRAHQQVTDPPAGVLSDQRHQRHADHVGHRQPGEHDRHRRAALLRRNELAGQDRGDPEVGPVRQSGEKPQHQQRGEPRHRRRGEVADGEDERDRDQQPLARQPHGRGGQQRRADDHPERVGGDELAGPGDRDVQAGGHVRQQPQGHELAGADPKAAERERQQRASRRGQRGGGAVRRRCWRCHPAIYSATE